MIDLQRLDQESLFEWKLRCIRAKKNHETDLDWAEIVELLGLDVTPDHFRKTASGIIEYDEYLIGASKTATTILSVSDLHVPFQLPAELLSKYAGRIDILQLNGDITDFAQISKFPKAYRSSPVEEIIEARQYIIELISMIKPKKVVVTYGNHDERYQNYLAKKINDSDLLELHPENQLELIFEDGFKHYNKLNGVKTYYEPLTDIFPDVEIEYTHKWYCQIGDTIFCHPMAFSGVMMKTAEKAMLWFRNEGYNFKNLVMAHTHRVGQYKIGNTNIYEQGCFCDVTKLRYADGKLINSQKEGFIVICQDKDGNTITEKTKLISLN